MQSPSWNTPDPSADRSARLAGEEKTIPDKRHARQVRIPPFSTHNSSEEGYLCSIVFWWRIISRSYKATYNNKPKVSSLPAQRFSTGVRSVILQAVLTRENHFQNFSHVIYVAQHDNIVKICAKIDFFSNPHKICIRIFEWQGNFSDHSKRPNKPL